MMKSATINVNPIAVKHGMALAAAVAFLIATNFAVVGDIPKAVANYGMTLFFAFAYFNPTLMLVRRINQFESLVPRIAQKKFLWAALALVVIGLALEFRALALV